MKKIYPILLAGGSGTRLWPLSRKSYPKQFTNLIGNKSLFQESALRLTSSHQIKFTPHVTLTNHDFRFIVGVLSTINDYFFDLTILYKYSSCPADPELENI